MTPVKQKMLVLKVLLLAAAGYSIESQACYLMGAEQRSSFNMGTIVVQRDTPTGTVLSEKAGHKVQQATMRPVPVATRRT